MNDKFFSMAQFVLTAFVFVCAAVGTIARIVTGQTSLAGFVAYLSLLAIAWVLVRLSWKELREED